MSAEKKKESKPLVLRGTLMILKRKCGKTPCRCEEGNLHQTPVLSYSVGGVTRLLSLREPSLPEVKGALARYRKASADLEQEALRGIATLRQRLQQEKAAEKRKRR
jgi:hypothetical protein